MLNLGIFTKYFNIIMKKTLQKYTKKKEYLQIIIDKERMLAS